MADKVSYWTSPDGVRINISHLGPDQVSRVKAMGTGAKASALATTLSKMNVSNSGVKLRDSSTPAAAPQGPITPFENGQAVTKPTFGDGAAASTATGPGDPGAGTIGGTSQGPPIIPTESTPIDKSVKVDPAIDKKTGATNVVTATTNAEELAADAAIKNFNLNNPNTVTDANGNVRRTVLNADGTTSIVNTAGEGLKASQDAFTGALGTVKSNGALNLSGAPQIDASGAGRDKAQDAVYNYITKTYQRDKSRDLETAKQELAQRGIPIDADPNSLWGKTVASIDEKYQGMDDQAKNQAVTQGNQYFATNVGAQSTAHDAFVGDTGAMHQSGINDVATLGGVVGSQQPTGMPSFAGSQYDDQAQNYAGFTQLEVNRIMQERGYNVQQAIAALQARKSGGSSGGTAAPSTTDSFGGEAT